MNRLNYTAAHSVLQLSSKRFQQSPYIDRYLSDDLVFGLYSNRFYPLSGADNVVEKYWHLRRQVMLYDVPEKPLSIQGPDSVAFLEKLFTRTIADLKIGRARYAIACNPAGGIVMDGVLIRLSDDHFWYIHADGNFELWMQAWSEGFNVAICDPDSRVLQIQGPRSLELLRKACPNVPDHFGYFHSGFFDFNGQKLLVSRTGWTGELGFEIYSQGQQTDHLALWDYIIEIGKKFDLQSGPLDSMGIRRLEAGILDYGTDIDSNMTPFEAGVGMFVNVDKSDFIGKNALEKSSRDVLLMGLFCENETPLAGTEIQFEGQKVGVVTAGAWSPYLDKGIGFVRFSEAGDWKSCHLELVNRSGEHYSCQASDLPFYDSGKEIPRGIVVAKV